MTWSVKNLPIIKKGRELWDNNLIKYVYYQLKKQPRYIR